MSQPDFTFHDRVGLLFTVEGASYVISISICHRCISYIFRSLSICAVTIILVYALVRNPHFHHLSSSNLLFQLKWMGTWGNRDSDESEASDSILFLNLMLADLIQGIGMQKKLVL
jgi:hypothetical protein